MGIRIWIASHFGKLEHISARLLGLILFFDMIFYINQDYVFLGYGLKIALGLWLIYFLAHTFEKLFYPNNFR